MINMLGVIPPMPDILPQKKISDLKPWLPRHRKHKILIRNPPQLSQRIIWLIKVLQYFTADNQIKRPVLLIDGINISYRKTQTGEHALSYCYCFL